MRVTAGRRTRAGRAGASEGGELLGGGGGSPSCTGAQEQLADWAGTDVDNLNAEHGTETDTDSGHGIHSTALIG